MKKSIVILVVFVFIFTIGYQGLVLGKNTPQEEKNLKIAKLLVEEGFNKGNLNVVDEIATADFKSYWNGVLEEKTGPEVLKDSIKFNRDSYDFKVGILDSIAKEDKVVIRWDYKGKHKKSGKQVSFTGIFIAVFKKGKMIEVWQTYDSLLLYKQLGYTLNPPDWAKEK